MLLPPPTEKFYHNLDELLASCQSWAFQQGYALIIRRQKPKAIYLNCDRSGKPKSTLTIRTKKTDCPFKIVGKYCENKKLWSVTNNCQSHNHQASSDPTLHPVHRRLSVETKRLVIELQSSGKGPREIIRILEDNHRSDQQFTTNIQTVKNFMRCQSRKSGGSSSKDPISSNLRGNQRSWNEHRTGTDQTPSNSPLEDTGNDCSTVGKVFMTDDRSKPRPTVANRTCDNLRKKTQKSLKTESLVPDPVVTQTDSINCTKVTGGSVRALEQILSTGRSTLESLPTDLVDSQLTVAGRDSYEDSLELIVQLFHQLPEGEKPIKLKRMMDLLVGENEGVSTSGREVDKVIGGDSGDVGGLKTCRYKMSREGDGDDALERTKAGLVKEISGDLMFDNHGRRMFCSEKSSDDLFFKIFEESEEVNSTTSEGAEKSKEGHHLKINEGLDDEVEFDEVEEDTIKRLLNNLLHQQQT